MRFLIDDERFLLPGEIVPDIIARTYSAGVLILGLAIEKDEVWLDHDLGEEDPDKTGYRLITYYEEFIAYKHSLQVYPTIPKFRIITNNPAGRKRIQQVINSIERLRAGVNPKQRLQSASDFPPRLARERSSAPWRWRTEKEVGKKQES